SSFTRTSPRYGLAPEPSRIIASAKIVFTCGSLLAAPGNSGGWLRWHVIATPGRQHRVDTVFETHRRHETQRRPETVVAQHPAAGGNSDAFALDHYTRIARLQ